MRLIAELERETQSRQSRPPSPKRPRGKRDSHLPAQ